MRHLSVSDINQSIELLRKEMRESGPNSVTVMSFSDVGESMSQPKKIRYRLMKGENKRMEAEFASLKDAVEYMDFMNLHDDPTAHVVDIENNIIVEKSSLSRARTAVVSERQKFEETFPIDKE